MTTTSIVDRVEVLALRAVIEQAKRDGTDVVLTPDLAERLLDERAALRIALIVIRDANIETPMADACRIAAGALGVS